MARRSELGRGSDALDEAERGGRRRDANSIEDEDDFDESQHAVYLSFIVKYNYLCNISYRSRYLKTRNAKRPKKPKKLWWSHKITIMGNSSASSQAPLTSPKRSLTPVLDTTFLFFAIIFISFPDCYPPWKYSPFHALQWSLEYFLRFSSTFSVLSTSSYYADRDF